METQGEGTARGFKKSTQTEGEEETPRGSVGGSESKSDERKTL